MVVFKLYISKVNIHSTNEWLSEALESFQRNFRDTYSLNDICRFFLHIPPPKALSVEDGKIPTKKVKVRVKTSHLAVEKLHFQLFGRDFTILNTFGGRTSKKKPPCTIVKFTVDQNLNLKKNSMSIVHHSHRTHILLSILHFQIVLLS